MIDTRYNKPLHVSMEYPPAPYIRLPFSQLNDVRRLLDSHHSQLLGKGNRDFD